jgi:opacity protein-like surface antigen
MNMKKLLATGLIASVAMSSAESSASCGNGGFYVGANFGVAFTKAKATTEAHTYTATEKFGGSEVNWAIDTENANDKKIAQGHANAYSKQINEMLKTKKNKTKVLAELVLGYDFRLNDVMLGVEINVGGIFGTNKLRMPETKIPAATHGGMGGANADTTTTAIDYAKVKEQWHIALMPRVGYLFTPQFEGYVTFGVKLVKFKTSALNLPYKMAVATATLTPDQKAYSKKSTKAVFLAGAGVRYEFNPSMFAKLEYNFEFGAKPKLHADAMPELQKVKVTSHTIKLGLGYRF